MNLFLSGFCLGVATLWAFLEMIAYAARRRVPPPTLRRRKHRDSPERNQVGELREGVERTGGIDYKWINLTGEEQ